MDKKNMPPENTPGAIDTEQIMNYASTEHFEVPPPADPNKKRPVGRPRGSKNKPKDGESATPGTAVAKKPYAGNLKGYEEYQAMDGAPETGRAIMQIIACEQIGKHADVNDPNTLHECLDAYIQLCLKNQLRLTNLSAYSACGVTRAMVFDWYTGSKRSNDPRYKEFAQRIRSVCGEYRELMMADGKLNPVTGIWWQKVYEGYTDQPTVVVERNNDRAEVSPDEIADKYGGVFDDDN